VSDDASDHQLDAVTFGRPVRDWVAVDPHRFQHTMRVLTAWAWRAAFRSKGYGAQHVPRSGGLLLCPNHNSWVDIFLQLECQPRDVHLMGKAEFFRVPGFTAVARRGGGYPVERGRSDSAAVNISRVLLEHGRVVVMYPEGTRTGGSRVLGPPRSGPAVLAMQTGVPVVMIASAGIRGKGDARRWGRMPRVTTVLGHPMRFSHNPEPARADVEAARDRMWEYEHTLLELAHQINDGRRRPKSVAVPLPPDA
jgi:1-acyl-sn-glycerol-3-phosphate acyltransferase